jgi:hypothetical protein
MYNLLTSEDAAKACCIEYFLYLNKLRRTNILGVREKHSRTV